MIVVLASSFISNKNHSAALKVIALILVIIGNSHSHMQSSEFQRQYLDEFDLICLLQGLMIFVNN